MSVPSAKSGVTGSKVCTGCGQAKPLGDFYFAGGRPRSKCKLCYVKKTSAYYATNKSWYAEYSKTYRRSNREHLNALNGARMLRGRIERQSWVDAYKQTHGCADCGRKFDPIQLDFDHVRGKKRCEVSRLVTRCASRETLEREMSLCDVVCAACHRLRTWTRRQASLKPAHARKTTVTTQRNHAAAGAFVRNAKDAPCTVCGLKLHYVAMDLHHLDPKEKDFTLGDHGSRSRTALEREIAKCVLVCACCHRLIHAGRAPGHSE